DRAYFVADSGAVWPGGDTLSRYYGMEVSINGHAPDRAKAIKAAATEVWPFDDWNETDGGIVSSAEDHLYGGETEEEFSLRLAEAIWRANGAYCQVRVKATYLEEIPSELHCPDEDDYHRLAGRRRTRGRCRQKRR
ncbi:MAG: hypothetical protein WCK89_19715, partial [bacterium]